MGGRIVVVAVVAVILSVATPFYIAKNLKLGAHAKSPQTVEMMAGSHAVVAGGRAKLWYAGGNTGGDFEIQCSKETRYIEPERGEPYSGCGITVKLEEVDDDDGRRPPRATFRVEW